MNLRTGLGLLAGLLGTAGSAWGATLDSAPPTWARDAVWYQIFPERFRNGDPGNDPRVEDLRGSWPHDIQGPWHVHPWTSDWYEQQPWERANGRGLWPNVQRRRYGGDLQGVLDRLDYLQDLGVTAIYLNPIFASPSLHKYDGMTYHHVDPTFGPDRAGDERILADENPGDFAAWKWTAADRLLLKLVEACHARGMRLILDGVFNHMGLRSWVFEDVKQRQQASPYKDWFIIRSWDDAAAGTTFDYAGWSNAREVPEWREDENGLVAGPRDYVFAITRRWMDPDGDGDPRDGVDGWRLDVAFCVAHPFWKAWRAHVKSINPDAYLVAEVVDPPEQTRPFLAGDEFDAVMNYNFAFACDEFLLSSHPIPASAFDARLRELRDAFAPETAYVQFNVFDSHDTARLATHAIEAGQLNYRHWGSYYMEAKGDRGLLPVRAPNEAERRRARLVVLMQMTYVGAPVIYYGDEAGLWGPNDPDCRKPMVWPELDYSPEAFNADGSPRNPPDPVRFDADLHAFYRTLATMRRANEALRRGGFRTALADDEHRVYAFWREQDDERLLVVLNASDSPATARVDATGPWSDLLDPAYVATETNGVLDLDLPPVSGRVLKSRTILHDETR